jgi:hypothetical protein
LGEVLKNKKPVMKGLEEWGGNKALCDEFWEDRDLNGAVYLSERRRMTFCVWREKNIWKK